MTEFTKDQMFAYAERRNRETGRRTDYVRWIKVCTINHGQAVFVGIQSAARELTVQGVGLWRRGGRPGHSFVTIGVKITGPVVVDGGPVQILYAKPLAAPVDPKDPSIVWFKSLSGIVTMQPPKLNDLTAIVCHPGNFDAHEEIRMVELPLNVCPGDKVIGVTDQLRDTVGRRDIAFRIDVLDPIRLSAFDAVGPLELAIEWEPNWLDDFLNDIS